MNGPPPVEFSSGDRAVPVSIEQTDLVLRFRLKATPPFAEAEAVVAFHVEKPGNPLFAFVPKPERATLDGHEVGFGAVRVLDPDREPLAGLREVKEEVRPGKRHRLRLIYKPPFHVIEDGGVGFAFFMSDAESREGQNFLEQFVPTNLEHDRINLRVRVDLKGASRRHHLFTNGTVGESQACYTFLNGWQQSWKVKYPDYYGASSPFLHLIGPRGAWALYVHQALVSTPAGRVPVTVYSRRAETAHRMELVREFLPKLVQTYGPYPHPSLLIYDTPKSGHGLAQGTQGMEYCGAAVSCADALEHELVHSWFGRGILPAGGRSGWIDEAIAERYVLKISPRELKGDAGPLADLSPYRRSTPGAAYWDGVRVLQDVDHKLSGGLDSVLSSMAAGLHGQRITTPQFEGILTEAGADVHDLFVTAVYGGQVPTFSADPVQGERIGEELREPLPEAAPGPHSYSTEDMYAQL